MVDRHGGQGGGRILDRERRCNALHGIDRRRERAGDGRPGHRRDREQAGGCGTGSRWSGGGDRARRSRSHQRSQPRPAGASGRRPHHSPTRQPCLRQRHDPRTVFCRLLQSDRSVLCRRRATGPGVVRAGAAARHQAGRGALRAAGHALRARGNRRCRQPCHDAAGAHRPVRSGAVGRTDARPLGTGQPAAPLSPFEAEYPQPSHTDLLRTSLAIGERLAAAKSGGAA